MRKRVKYKYLSYTLTDEIPVYGGKASINMSKIKSIASGDSANICKFTLESHWGTHADLPAHFFKNGKEITDYPPGFWFFKSPEVIKIKLSPSEILCCGRWVENINRKTDILLLKSGWGKHRSESCYITKNPGIHPDVGLYLRNNYRNLRAVGIDWISISPYQDRALGRESHKAFLSPKGKNKPIIIIEDIDLDQRLKGLKEIFVSPLRIENIDSAPCTVTGSFYD